MNIDFSKVEENKFIAIVDDGIRIYDNYEIIFPRGEHFLDDTTIISVSFSHDDNYIIIQEVSGELYIVSYNDLILNRRSFIFTFDTDYMPVKYVVSPNRNQIAILFNMRNDCYYSFDDSVNVYIENPLGNNQLAQIVQVYDFTPGSSRLIFNKHFEGHIFNIVLSEYDSLALNGTIRVDGNDYGLNIFDLETGNLILYNSRPNSINLISFFPISEDDDTRKILLISNEPDSDFNNFSIRRLDDFEIIDELLILEGIDINAALIKTDGEITIVSEDGLVFFNFSGQPIRNRNLFRGHNIKNISYSISGNIIGITPIRISRDEDLDYETYFLIYDLVNDQFLTYEDQLNFGFEHDEFEYDEDQHEDDDEDDDELVFYDPELSSCPIPPANKEKLGEFSNHTCYDTIQLNEENIGDYLSSDQDNIVIFYKEPSDEGFSATCLTFTGLRSFLKDPLKLFYSCTEGKDFSTYHHGIPHYVHLPSQAGNLFLNYNDIKQKYIQRQNMIFLEYSKTIAKTISYDASIRMQFISSNHCQEGSSIRVYRIIF